MRKGYKYVNTRQYLRLPVSHLIKYRLLEEDKGMDVSTSRDISLGGISFLVKEELPVSSIIEVVIKASEATDPIKAIAKIVRIEPLKGTGAHKVGAYFLQIKNEDRAFLSKAGNTQFVYLAAPYFSVKYKVLEKDRSDLLTISSAKDIGAGGISFATRERLSSPDIVELEISFPATQLPVQAIAKIVRVEPAKETNAYITAAQYLMIAEEDKSAIDEYVKEVLGKSSSEKKWWWRKV